MPLQNQVVEIYKGVKIRKCNRVVLKLGVSAFKKILDEVDKTNLSIGKVLAYSGKPCDKCKNTCTVAYDKDGERLEIKKGLLSNHIPENNGINVIKQAQNKK